MKDAAGGIEVPLSNDEIIAGLWSGMVGRDEIAHAKEVYLQHGGAGLRALALHLAKTYEFKTRTEASVMAGQFAVEAPEFPRVEHALSLGTHCFIGSLLRRMGVRRCAGPFDWVFASPQMVRHCLEDRFQTFLSRKYHRRFKEGGAEHDFYRGEFGVGSVFNHHDITEDAINAKYVRRVERLLSVLSASDSKLLAQCYKLTGVDPHAEFERLCRLVDDRFQNCYVACFVVSKPDRSRLLPRVEQLAGSARHRLMLVEPTSELLGTEFESVLDDLAIARALGRLPLARQIVRQPIPGRIGGSLPDISQIRSSSPFSGRRLTVSPGRESPIAGVPDF